MPQILYETKVDEDKFKLLEQIARQRHMAVSSLIDQAIDEILRKYLPREDSVVERLKRNPDPVKKLGEYNRHISSIEKMRIRILPVTREDIKKSAQIRQVYGLLTND